MQEIISKLVEEITDPRHYLKIAQEAKSNYFDDFLVTGKIMREVLNPKEYDIWCKEKMSLRSLPFAEKTFIQSAVETSVARFFAEYFPANFKVEVKVNTTNDKDVDCQFADAGFLFNIEVKCADFSSKEKIDNKKGFKFGTVGRLPDRGDEARKVISAALDDGMTKKGEPLMPHLISKNMDNNLMDFLISASDKFDPNPNENELNVLIVGCDEEYDMQNWFNYLWAEQGLFRPDSFADANSYRNVDLVVFTNLYYKHNKFFEKNVSNSWTLEHSFNLIFSNPSSRLTKANAIKHFVQILPNHTQELGKYIVPGSVPDYVKDSVRISWFVKDYLEKEQNRYYFSNKQTETT